MSLGQDWKRRLEMAESRISGLDIGEVTAQIDQVKNALNGILTSPQRRGLRRLQHALYTHLTALYGDEASGAIAEALQELSEGSGDEELWHNATKPARRFTGHADHRKPPGEDWTVERDVNFQAVVPSKKAHSLSVFDIVEYQDVAPLQRQKIATTAIRFQAFSMLGPVYCGTHRGILIGLSGGRGHIVPGNGFTKSQLSMIPDTEAVHLAVLLNDSRGGREELPQGVSPKLVALYVEEYPHKKYTVIDFSRAWEVHYSTPLRKIFGTLTEESCEVLDKAIRRQEDARREQRTAETRRRRQDAKLPALIDGHQPDRVPHDGRQSSMERRAEISGMATSLVADRENEYAVASTPSSHEYTQSGTTPQKRKHASSTGANVEVNKRIKRDASSGTKNESATSHRYPVGYDTAPAYDGPIYDEDGETVLVPNETSSLSAKSACSDEQTLEASRNLAAGHSHQPLQSHDAITNSTAMRAAKPSTYSRLASHMADMSSEDTNRDVRSTGMVSRGPAHLFVHSNIGAAEATPAMTPDHSISEGQSDRDHSISDGDNYDDYTKIVKSDDDGSLDGVSDEDARIGAETNTPGTTFKSTASKVTTSEGAIGLSLAADDTVSHTDCTSIHRQEDDSIPKSYSEEPATVEAPAHREDDYESLISYSDWEEYNSSMDDEPYLQTGTVDWTKLDWNKIDWDNFDWKKIDLEHIEEFWGIAEEVGNSFCRHLDECIQSHRLASIS